MELDNNSIYRGLNVNGRRESEKLGGFAKAYRMRFWQSFTGELA